jgi:hypothetical protein
MNKDVHERNSPRETRNNIAIGFIIGLMIGGLIDLFTGDRGIWTVIGMALGSLFGYRGLPRLYLMEYPPKVIRNLVVSGAFFFVIFLGSIYLIDQDIGGAYQTLIALAPTIPLLIFIIVIAKAISSLDELQRRIQVEAIAIGFGLTILLVLAIGLLGLTGIPQPDWLFVSLIMVFSWLVGKLWTRWKYG